MRTFAEYFARAESLLAAGFTSKAAQKDALDYTSRAFDCNHDLLQDKLLAMRDTGDIDGKSPRFHALYSTPQCCHWNAKRAALYADFPVYVDAANRCAALRDAIKAAPVAKKAPTRTPAQIKKDAESKECQICGRAIFAEVGVIAHHGYTRPGYGFQTASCYGARHLPYEASADLLPGWIESLVAMEARQRATLADIVAERVAIARPYETRKPNGRREYAGTVHFTRETLEAVKAETPAAFAGGHMRTDFDTFKGYEVREVSRSIESTVETLAYARARLAAWTLRMTWNATSNKWESV